MVGEKTTNLERRVLDALVQHVQRARFDSEGVLFAARSLVAAVPVFALPRVPLRGVLRSMACSRLEKPSLFCRRGGFDGGDNLADQSTKKKTREMRAAAITKVALFGRNVL